MRCVTLGASGCVFTSCVAPQNLTARIIRGAARVGCLHCLISLSVRFSDATGVGGWDISPQFIRSSLHLQQSSLLSPFPGIVKAVTYCELILLLTSCMSVSSGWWITWKPELRILHFESLTVYWGWVYKKDTFPLCTGQIQPVRSVDFDNWSLLSFSPDDIGSCWYILLSGSVFIKESMFLPRSRWAQQTFWLQEEFRSPWLYNVCVPSTKKVESYSWIKRTKPILTWTKNGDGRFHRSRRHISLRRLQKTETCVVLAICCDRHLWSQHSNVKLLWFQSGTIAWAASVGVSKTMIISSLGLA